MATVIVEGTPLRARRARSRFYVGAAILITAIVIVGFAPASYRSLTIGPSPPWIVHVHAVVYFGWLALLITQTVLAARGRLRLHRRVGNFGIAYGGLVLIIGLIVSFAAPVLHAKAGQWTVDEAASFLPTPLGDMVLFGGFFGAAIAYRARAEVHKRLVLLATVALMFAAVGRLWFVGSPPNVPLALAAWYLPVLAGIAFDLFSTRRIHPVYLIGVVIMALGLARLPFGQSELWLAIGRPLIIGLS